MIRINPLELTFLNLILLVAVITSLFVENHESLMIGDQRSSENLKPANDDSEIVISSYSWEKVIIPEGIDYYDFAIHPIDAYTVFMASSNGIFKTTNAGDSWIRMENSPAKNIYQIAISQSNPNRIFGYDYADLYRSDDGGDNWTYFALPTTCDLTIAPSDSDRVYCRRLFNNDGPTFFRSNDGGETWITPNVSFSERLLDMAIAPDNPEIVVALDWDNGGFQKSINGGIGWVKSLNLKALGGKLIFDPAPPHILYLGGKDDLYRSKDYGTNWEFGGLYSNSTAFGVSPFRNDELIGGNTRGKDGWRIQSKEFDWSLAIWSTPNPINWFLICHNDDRAIYAHSDEGSDEGLWRFIRRTRSWPHSIYMPIIENDNISASFPNSAVQALDRSNFYRDILGLVPLILDSKLNQAAQNHANYILLNKNDPSAWENVAPHGEVEGKPGFTGQDQWRRLEYSGYEGSAAYEVIAYINNPIESVDAWINSPFHREPFLNPFFIGIGYGSGKNNWTNVDVMEIGNYGFPNQGSWSIYLQPKLSSYPINGQNGIPTSWDGNENPDPLPPGASKPVGYPFTIYSVDHSYGILHLNGFELRDSQGQLVPIHPNPAYCEWHCLAVIPISPLRPNETYTVHVSGNANNSYEFDRTWTFTTGSD